MPPARRFARRRPVSHLHPVLAALWTESRLTTPMASLIGAPVGPFVSKLNFKRADLDRAVTVTAAAGSVLMFPGLMVHRSAPNRTATDRRSLLFCFQPVGRPELSALTYHPERLADLP